jgi:hypothetical protein
MAYPCNYLAKANWLLFIALNRNGLLLDCLQLYELPPALAGGWIRIENQLIGFSQIF